MRANPMRNPWLPAMVVFGLIAVTPVLAAPPVRITLARMPQAVQKTVRAETAGGRIRGLWKEIDESGKTVYEVESSVKGKTKDLNIGEDGTILVCEQQMTLAELPASVRETMLSAAGKRRIRMIESVTKLGQLAYYEAHVGVGRAEEEITVGLDGSRLPQ